MSGTHLLLKTSCTEKIIALVECSKRDNWTEAERVSRLKLIGK